MGEGERKGGGREERRGEEEAKEGERGGGGRGRGELGEEKGPGLIGAFLHAILGRNTALIIKSQNLYGMSYWTKLLAILYLHKHYSFSSDL